MLPDCNATKKTNSILKSQSSFISKKTAVKFELNGRIEKVLSSEEEDESESRAASSSQVSSDKQPETA